MQRVLGREVYGQQEQIAWSIVVATQGIVGLIDQLLNSNEYLEAFGYNTVPYQRRRVLPGRAMGEMPFNLKSPRYDKYYRRKLGFPQFVWQVSVRSYKTQGQQTTAGHPSQFLDMARSLSAQGNPPQRLSTANIDIEKSVPYRES